MQGATFDAWALRTSWVLQPSISLNQTSSNEVGSTHGRARVTTLALCVPIHLPLPYGRSRAEGGEIDDPVTLKGGGGG